MKSSSCIAADSLTLRKRSAASPSVSMSISKKRAADGPSVPSKTKKRKPNSHGDESLDTEAGVNTLFEQLDSQLLADHYAQKLSRFGGDLSSVELSDLTVSGKIS